MNLESLLNFLGKNSEVFAAIGAILESIVILVNALRKWKNKGDVGVMSTSSSMVRTCLWAVNPINCFRKIK